MMMMRVPVMVVMVLAGRRLVVASSSFIYVALADLIPQLQKRLSARETLAQIFWLLAGIGMVTVVSSFTHG